MFRLLSLVSLILVVSFPVKADLRCSVDQSKPINYFNEKRGQVILYKVDDISSVDLNCLIAKEFLKRVYKFPDKFTFGVVTKEFQSIKIMQWKLNDNYFLNIEANLIGGSGIGTFTRYSDPLNVLRNFFVGESFPIKKHSLDNSVQTKHVFVTTASIKELLGIDQRLEK